RAVRRRPPRRLPLPLLRRRHADRAAAMTLAFSAETGDGPARAGIVTTVRGSFRTPCFMPVGTRAAVRAVSTDDLEALGFEVALAAQEALGADIQMALDVCPPLPSPDDVVRRAVDRTAAWAVRARRAHRREGQALFGIVQGGTDERLRRESARRTVELEFDG